MEPPPAPAPIPIETLGPRPSNRVLVVFGATGDLAARKLFPGFYRLFCEGMMPEDFRIIGSGRHSPGSDEDFREHIREGLRQHGLALDGHWDEFAGRLSFVRLRREAGRPGRGGPGGRARDRCRGERLVYLSVPPGAMQDMVRMLGDRASPNIARWWWRSRLATIWPAPGS